MVGGLEKSSFSNIEQQSLKFVKYTLDPLVVRWKQAMCRVLLSNSEKANYFSKNITDRILKALERPEDFPLSLSMRSRY